MISADVIANVAAVSVQVALVATIASLVLWTLRLDAPGVRYAYWRAVATLCVALPWIQPRVHPRAGSLATVVEGGATAVSSAAAESLRSGLRIAPIVMLIVAAGAVLRLAWLAVGLAKLHRLRQSARSEASLAAADELQQPLRTRAEVRIAPGLAHPVTFGLFRPVVLLPASLRHQPPEIQRAVIGHELIHVQRRDWAWLVAEEVALCLTWFHPAAWWMASRIQLAREEVVDELAVLLTGRRKSYVEALLAFSDSTSVVPTAAFARRRHLLRRVALISREDSMSSTRIVASCAVMAAAVLTGSWSAVSAFPLRTATSLSAQLSAGPGTLEQRAHKVTPENPVPRRIHYEAPVMPDVGEVTGATVLIKVTLDDVGRIAEARPTEVIVKAPNFEVSVAGDNFRGQLERDLVGRPAETAAMARQAVEAFVQAAITSIRAWRYDPPAEAPLTFGITTRFSDSPEQMIFTPKESSTALHVGGVIKPPVKIQDARPVYPQEARAAGVKGVVILEVRIGVDGGIEDAHVLKSIPQLDQAALDAVRQWKFVPTLMNGQPTAVIMTVTINFDMQ